jgi:hypothetical protein
MMSLVLDGNASVSCLNVEDYNPKKGS